MEASFIVVLASIVSLTVYFGVTVYMSIKSPTSNHYEKDEGYVIIDINRNC